MCIYFFQSFLIVSKLFDDSVYDTAMIWFHKMQFSLQTEMDLLDTIHCWPTWPDILLVSRKPNYLLPVGEQSLGISSKYILVILASPLFLPASVLFMRSFYLSFDCTIFVDHHTSKLHYVQNSTVPLFCTFLTKSSNCTVESKFSDAFVFNLEDLLPILW